MVRRVVIRLTRLVERASPRTLGRIEDNELKTRYSVVRTYAAVPCLAPQRPADKKADRCLQRQLHATVARNRKCQGMEESVQWVRHQFEDANP